MLQTLGASLDKVKVAFPATHGVETALEGAGARCISLNGSKQLRLQAGAMHLSWSSSHDQLLMEVSLPRLVHGHNAVLLTAQEMAVIESYVRDCVREALGIELPPSATWVFRRAEFAIDFLSADSGRLVRLWSARAPFHRGGEPALLQSTGSTASQSNRTRKQSVYEKQEEVRKWLRTLKRRGLSREHHSSLVQALSGVVRYELALYLRDAGADMRSLQHWPSMMDWWLSGRAIDFLLESSRYLVSLEENYTDLDAKLSALKGSPKNARRFSLAVVIACMGWERFVSNRALSKRDQRRLHKELESAGLCPRALHAGRTEDEVKDFVAQHLPELGPIFALDLRDRID